MSAAYRLFPHRLPCMCVLHLQPIRRPTQGLLHRTAVHRHHRVHTARRRGGREHGGCRSGGPRGWHVTERSHVSCDPGGQGGAPDTPRKSLCSGCAIGHTPCSQWALNGEPLRLPLGVPESCAWGGARGRVGCVQWAAVWVCCVGLGWVGFRAADGMLLAEGPGPQALLGSTSVCDRVWASIKPLTASGLPSARSGCLDPGTSVQNSTPCALRCSHHAPYITHWKLRSGYPTSA